MEKRPPRFYGEARGRAVSLSAACSSPFGRRRGRPSLTSLRIHLAGSPGPNSRSGRRWREPGGIEPSTSSLRTTALSQLSYGPMVADFECVCAKHRRHLQPCRGQVENGEIAVLQRHLLRGSLVCRGLNRYLSSLSSPREPLPHARRSSHRLGLSSTPRARLAL